MHLLEVLGEVQQQPLAHEAGKNSAAAIVTITGFEKTRFVR